MKLVQANSLAATLDAVNDAHFHRRKPSKTQREGAARWIAGRQGLHSPDEGVEDECLRVVPQE